MNKAVLDPTKEVRSFDTSQISLVRRAGNGKPFLLIQDDYTMRLRDAVAVLTQLLGPLARFVHEEAQSALDAAYGVVAAITPAEDAMPMYSLAQEAEHPFAYEYPNPATVVELIEGLEVPEGAPLASPVAILRALVAGYAPDGWPLSPTAIYTPASVLKAAATAHVISRAIAGESATAMASLAAQLEAGKGIVVLPGTALWELLDHPAAARAMGGDAEDNGPGGDNGSDEASEDESPTAHTGDKNHLHMHDNGTSHSHAHKHESGNTSHDGGPHSDAEDSGPNGDQGADEDTEGAQRTMPDKGSSYIRSIMEQQDPTMRVEPEAPAPRIAPAATQRSVNPEVRSTGVLEGDLLTEEQVRSALADPALTEVQRAGIVRSFTDQLERTLLEQAAPTGPVTDAAAITAAVAAAVGPLRADLEQIKRTLEQTDDRPNTRRSLPPTPRSDEDGTVVRRHPYAPASIRELADRNTVYSR